MIPPDPLAAAQCRQFCSYVACFVHQNQDEPNNIDLGLERLEALATRTSGRHVIGDEITMAECFLIPQLDNARRHRVVVTPARFPTLLRCEAAVAASEEFERAHASRQEDFTVGAYRDYLDFYNFHHGGGGGGGGRGGGGGGGGGNV